MIDLRYVVNPQHYKVPDPLCRDEESLPLHTFVRLDVLVSWRSLYSAAGGEGQREDGEDHASDPAMTNECFLFV